MSYAAECVGGGRRDGTRAADWGGCAQAVVLDEAERHLARERGAADCAVIFVSAAPPSPPACLCLGSLRRWVVLCLARAWGGRGGLVRCAIEGVIG